MIWFIFSIVYTVLEKGLLGPLNYYPSTGNPYDFRIAVFITPLSALLTGLLHGSIQVLYINNHFRKLRFGKRLFYKSVISLAIILLFLVVVIALANYVVSDTFFFSRQVWTMVGAFFFNYTFLSIVLYIALTILVSQFYAEISEKVGWGVLQNFFTGKYHTPVEEDRIFMFLDMKSSTTIAEHIGHIRYFDMLKEYYADLSEPVMNHCGEIYQYVGDEIVVSWTLKKGLQQHNCVRCFFAMKAALRRQAAKYGEIFGLLPEFKAGFHCGTVTTGEIEVLKKDITFTGDVLNTTSRIQGLCNLYHVDNLISGELIKKLDLHSGFHIKALGENELRGRGEKIALFTILSC